MGMFGGDCREADHRLTVPAENICEYCLRSNTTALEEYLEGISETEWNEMTSGWICTGTGSLQHMQALGCCCSAKSKTSKARTRNRAISELLHAVMERLRSDTEGGACILPEVDGVVDMEQTRSFRIAPVLTIICKYAAAEVIAFLKGINPGVKMENETIVLLMDNLNPGADLTLPDCFDTDGCQAALAHTTFLVDGEGPGVEELDGEDNPLEDSSVEEISGPNDNENNLVEMEDDSKDEVEYLGEGPTEKSDESEGEGTMSGDLPAKNVREIKGINKRDKEGRQFNLPTVPRIHERQKLNQKITPDKIPGGIAQEFGDMLQRLTLNVQRELLCISHAMRHRAEPTQFPRISLVPDAFYNCTTSVLRSRGRFLASIRGEHGKMYYFPENLGEPVAKKARNSSVPAQERNREPRPLFSEQDYEPTHTHPYYPHDHFGSRPSHYGFKKAQFQPNHERFEHRFPLRKANLPPGPRSRSRGRGNPNPHPRDATSQRQIPPRQDIPAPFEAPPTRGRSSHSGTSSSGSRPIRGRGAGYAPRTRIPWSVQTQLDQLIRGDDIACPGPECSKVVRATDTKDGTPYSCPNCGLKLERYLLNRSRNINAAAAKGPHPATAEEAAAGKFNKN